MPWASESAGRRSAGVWICVLVLVSGVVACANRDSPDPGTGQPSGQGDSWVERAAAERGDDSQLFAGYTEDEIGLEYLVDEYFSDRASMSLTRYRTDEEYLEADATDDFESLSAEARDRDYFEQTVSLLFLALVR